MSDVETTAEAAPAEAAPAPEKTALTGETGNGKDQETTAPESETGAEAKAEDTKAEDTKAEGAEEETKEGAPESYADFDIPETIVVDEQTLEGFKGLAKELNLSQEGAQKLVDLHSQMVESQVGQWDTLRKDWLKEAKADKDIGGNNFEAAKEAGKRAVKEFGDEGFVELLETFGIGNHPAVIRFAAKVGEALGDDSIITSGRESKGEKTIAQRMFPTLPA